MPDHSPDVLAFAAALSDEIKAAAAGATSEHVRRGLVMADVLLHEKARAYAPRALVEAGPWLCGDCGTSNPGTSGKCVTCGYVIGPEATHVNEIAAARERRQLAGLPTVEVAVTESGLEMDFDLGEDPPKRR